MISGFGFASPWGKLQILLDNPFWRWDLALRIRRSGDYLAARALEKGRIADLLILTALAEKGFRPLPVPDRCQGPARPDGPIRWFPGWTAASRN
ncbi:MAG: hypothetical protein QN194_16430 [Armatimonadota bacterium]|nr:hypothetical protein [Armatimonadota bacterium]